MLQVEPFASSGHLIFPNETISLPYKNSANGDKGTVHRGREI